MTTKIRFINENKLKKPIQLKIISQMGVFVSNKDEDNIKQSRLDSIDEYSLKLSDIKKSKKGGESRIYDVGAINKIYSLIFGGKKGGQKNDQIDKIIYFYENDYAPRVGICTNNTDINLNSDDKAVNVSFLTNTNNDNDDDDDDDDDDEELIY